MHNVKSSSSDNWPVLSVRALYKSGVYMSLDSICCALFYALASALSPRIILVNSANRKIRKLTMYRSYFVKFENKNCSSYTNPENG